MRALVVTNMYPTPAAPARGSFVRDQVRALTALPGVDIELYAFEPGGGSPYPRAARALRRRYRDGEFDVVHAHFGLTAWAALALRGAPHVLTLHGTDLVVRRSRAATLAAVPFVDLVAPVSPSLASLLPARLVRGKCRILPAGVDMERFRPLDRGDARAQLGLDPHRRYVLFPAAPTRPEKRYDRARSLVEAIDADVALLALGEVAPEMVPLWVNAVDAVVVTSERESFGLAVLEALACDVPVLSTEVGIAPQVLRNVAGAWCGPFDLAVWRAHLEAVLADPDPRVAGHGAAEPYSALRCAEQVLEAWAWVRGRWRARRG